MNLKINKEQKRYLSLSTKRQLSEEENKELQILHKKLIADPVSKIIEEAPEFTLDAFPNVKKLFEGIDIVFDDSSENKITINDAAKEQIKENYKNL